MHYITSLDPKAAFFHVIDDHRWLTASGCIWNIVGAKVTSGAGAEAHLLMPNIDVIARDCLLLHARSLIKFYRNSGRPNDILLRDFNKLALSTDLDSKLEKYERPIEVHLLHLTDWRDPDYRNTSSKNTATFRPDWDNEAGRIVELIFESLKYVSDQSSPWQQPFKDLNTACTAGYRDKSHSWPHNLGEKLDVEKYLANFGV